MQQPPICCQKFPLSKITDHYDLQRAENQIAKLSDLQRRAGSMSHVSLSNGGGWLFIKLPSAHVMMSTYRRSVGFMSSVGTLLSGGRPQPQCLLEVTEGSWRMWGSSRNRKLSTVSTASTGSGDGNCPCREYQLLNHITKEQTLSRNKWASLS